VRILMALVFTALSANAYAGVIWSQDAVMAGNFAWEHESVSDAKAVKHLEAAKHALDLHFLTSVIGESTKAIEIDPGFIEAYLIRAYAYWRSWGIGVFDKAMDDYKEIIEKDPRCSPAYYHRANLYSSKEKYIDAARDFTELTRIYPAEPEFYWWEAVSYDRGKDLNYAIIAYQNFLGVAMSYASPGHLKKDPYQDKIVKAHKRIRALKIELASLTVGETLK